MDVIPVSAQMKSEDYNLGQNTQMSRYRCLRIHLTQSTTPGVLGQDALYKRFLDNGGKNLATQELRISLGATGRPDRRIEPSDSWIWRKETMECFTPFC